MEIIEYNESNKAGLPDGAVKANQYSVLVACSNCGRAVWAVEWKGHPIDKSIGLKACPNCETYSLRR
jgi:ribosomal protein L32